jgi:2-hydroxychromene-2-carboxylate isomerase
MMGDLIRLAERSGERRHKGSDDRRRRSARARTAAEFYFDLGCPFTYLLAEQLERAFDEVVWTPASAAAVRRACLSADAETLLRRGAERRAALLGLPLVWPERWPMDVSLAMRVAGRASEDGRGGRFVLAASRLAFCGGFDLGDPDILAEAAAAAGLGLTAYLCAARETRRDGAAEAVGRRLLAVGADQLPAVRVGRALFWGEARVRGAVAGARHARAANG